MNAKWLERIDRYRDSVLGFNAVVVLIQEKIKRQMYILKRYGFEVKDKKFGFSGSTKNGLLLHEARLARIYWGYWHELLRSKANFQIREPRRDDLVNKLLDIGYHYLVNVLRKKCHMYDIPTQLGILHKAQSKTSEPLIYDLMEWVRPVLVDEVLLAYLRKKKKFKNIITQKDIGCFIYMIKKKLDRKYYHRKRKQCLRLSFWIDLYLLEFRGAVSEYREFTPLFPSMRHDTRCKNK